MAKKKKPAPKKPAPTKAPVRTPVDPYKAGGYTNEPLPRFINYTQGSNGGPSTKQQAQQVLQRVEKGKTLDPGQYDLLRSIKLGKETGIGQGLVRQVGKLDLKGIKASSNIPMQRMITGKPLSKEEMQAQTFKYLTDIQAQQAQMAQGYFTDLAQQRDVMGEQYAQQNEFLAAQLEAITGSSEQQMLQYQSLLQGITQQQEYTLGSLRQQFSRENEQSLQTISALQRSIQQLGAPPAIDTRASGQVATVGLSGAQRASMQRQKSGTSGLRALRSIT